MKKLISLLAIAGTLMAPIAVGAQEFDRSRTALLVTDPQNDFLADDGAAWGLVKDNVLTLGVRNNIKTLLKSAKKGGAEIFVSPHYYYPPDAGWKNRGALQTTLKDIDMFAVTAPVGSQEFQNSGADFYEPYKEYILDGRTIVTSPHKIFGPESNDLVLQLRKRDIDTVLVAGFAANLCTDSHMRELMEQGFRVIMIEDAVGAPGEAAYQAALLNYGFIANAVWTTEEAAAFLRSE